MHDSQNPQQPDPADQNADGVAARDLAQAGSTDRGSTDRGATSASPRVAADAAETGAATGAADAAAAGGATEWESVEGDTAGSPRGLGQAADAAQPVAASSTATQAAGQDEVLTVVESEPERSPVTPAVRGLAAWSWRFLVIIAAATLLMVGLIQVKTVVIPVLIAALIAALLAPVVNWLARHHIPRALAALIALLGSLAVIAGLLTVAGAAITSGIQDLSETAWQGIQDIISWLSSGPLQIDESDLQSYLQQARQTLESNAQTILSGALSVGTTVGNVFVGLLIALFCLFFFLKDGSVIWSWLVRLFPRVARERADEAGKRAWHTLGGYVRTQIIVAFCDGVGIGFGAWLLDVPVAFALGVLVFIGSFIPIVGAVLTGFLAVAVALVSHGIWTSVIMLGVVLLVQQAESNLLQPLLMSRSLKLHPVAVLLAVAAGTIVAGIVGALFAVPLVAIANTVLHYLNGGGEPYREMPRFIQRVRTKRT